MNKTDCKFTDIDLKSSPKEENIKAKHPFESILLNGIQNFTKIQTIRWALGVNAKKSTIAIIRILGKANIDMSLYEIQNYR